MWRVAGVVAFFACLYVLKTEGRAAFIHAVVAKLRRAAPSHTIAEASAFKFALRWAYKFYFKGNVEEGVRRHGNMPDEVAVLVGERLYDGYEIDVEEEKGEGAKRRKVTHKQLVYYRSIHEFIERDPDVREVMAFYHIRDEGTLRRTLHRVHDQIPNAPPNMERVPIHPRAPLPPAHKEERFGLAGDLLGMGFGCSEGLDPLRHYLSRVCWIDSKTFYIEPREELGCKSCSPHLPAFPLWQPGNCNPSSTCKERLYQESRLGSQPQASICNACIRRPSAPKQYTASHEIPHPCSSKRWIGEDCVWPLPSLWGILKKLIILFPVSVQRWVAQRAAVPGWHAPTCHSDKQSLGGW
jgi:hypothetical protein